MADPLAARNFVRPLQRSRLTSACDNPNRLQPTITPATAAKWIDAPPKNLRYRRAYPAIVDSLEKLRLMTRNPRPTSVRQDKWHTHSFIGWSLDNALIAAIPLLARRAPNHAPSNVA
jgi:hypothetical protein